MGLAENLEQIEQRIRVACERAGRTRDAVLLLAVTKTHPPETIRAATELGLTCFGENKVQEAKFKIPNSPGNARWHFIGHLQSNKCRDAVELFEMIQSVDSLAIAREINKRAEQAAKTMPILLEINVAGEGSKFGYQPEQMLADLPAINTLPRLEIHGLMAIPPYAPVTEKARPYFQKLRALKAQAEDLLDAPLPHLSMGMSDDFAVAIEEGATIIRVGTALFGERTTRKAEGNG
ncbi:MAG: YggS family pyridoxal phosphate-dependent enzyme [Verrucomicrobia bacterium]|nr:YggS family pyridoxal phosphate-dependent enzyme [Verrucomicrobiota bacterium]